MPFAAAGPGSPWPCCCLSASSAYRIGLRLGRLSYRAALAALEQRDFRASRHPPGPVPGDRSRRSHGALLMAQTARRRGAQRGGARHLRILRATTRAGRVAGPGAKRSAVQQGDLRDVHRLLAFSDDNPDVPETPLILEACIEGSLQRSASARRRWLVDGPTATPRADADAAGHRSVAGEAPEPGGPGSRPGLAWPGPCGRQRPARRAGRPCRGSSRLQPDHFEARLYLAPLPCGEPPAEAALHLQALAAASRITTGSASPWPSSCATSASSKRPRTLLDELLAEQPDNLYGAVRARPVALDLQQPEDAERWLRRAGAAPMTRRSTWRWFLLPMSGRDGEARQYQERFQQLNARQQ